GHGEARARHGGGHRARDRRARRGLAREDAEAGHRRVGLRAQPVARDSLDGTRRDCVMPYTPKDFSRLLGTPGFSDQLLKDHFPLTEAYAKNTNTLLERAPGLRREGKAGTTPSPEYAELKRRFGWEFNGMRLHEIYFDNLTKGSRPATDRARAQL